MSIDVAIAEAGPGAEVRFYGQIGGDLDSLDRVIRKLRATGAQLQFAYEAGPCGYVVYRHLTTQGWPCLVAAPSLIPRRPGDRIKCDRRDALSLARLFRAGELTSVRVPDADDEAMRDLTRAREDAVSVERRAKQRTGALLLRHGRRYPGKTTWGRGHWRWLTQQVMEHPAQQIVLQEYLDAVREASARVQRLTGQIQELLPQWRREPFVAAYQALRGVSLIVAATMAAELGDLSRFNNPKELMAYLGLVPSEHSSGAMPAGSWWRRLGPTACEPGSPGRCSNARRAYPPASRRSPGRRNSACAPVIAGCWPGAKARTPWPPPSPENWRLISGPSGRLWNPQRLKE
jgi:transposase